MGKKHVNQVAASDLYYNFLKQFVTSAAEDARVFGKYYTDWGVAQRMADRALVVCGDMLNGDEINAVDPFSGDGRLIVCLVRSLANRSWKGRLNVALWDIDENALEKAKTAIETECRSLGISSTIACTVCDTFVDYKNHLQSFDICLTNPPWGLIKPLKALSRRCSEEEWTKYREALSDYQIYFEEEFSEVDKKKRFGKFGANLGRAGVEVAFKIVKTGGACCIVSPSSLFTDQVSLSLRTTIIQSWGVSYISFYPAELKLYGSADVSSVTFVSKVGEETIPVVQSFFSKEKSIEITFDEESWQAVKNNGLVIPLEAVGEAKKGSYGDMLFGYETVEDYCKKHGLKFCREIDETKITEKLTNEGTIHFAKGFMVCPYSFTPSLLFLNESKVSPPATVYKEKLVWRDVSRASQKKRVKATILTPPVIAGNSLGQIVCLSNEGNALRALLGIMNSYIFEFIMRHCFSSNHVASGVIKKAPIPPNVPIDELAALVDKALQEGKTQPEIEALVALLYAVDRPMLENALDSFVIPASEKQRILEEFDHGRKA